MLEKEKIALLATLVNFLLGAGKVVIGLFTGSVGVFADGLHSSLDVLSSFITYLGVKVAEKPVDEKHPYGYYRSETLAGLMVSIIVLLSTLWVLYEGFTGLLSPSPISMGWVALSVMLVSAVVNFVMSRLKFKYGTDFESLALIADARHSELDVLTSLGVVIGLVVNPYWRLADSIAALVVGLVLLKKSLETGAETTERLLDVSAGEEVESRIRRVADEVSQVSKVSEVKTRRIGENVFAELSLKVNPKLKVEQADKVSGRVEARLKDEIPKLKHLTVQIKPLEFVSKSAFGGFGYGLRKAGHFERIGPEKKGERIIIPVKDEDVLNDKFGSAKYLVVDVSGDNIIREELMSNPYHSSKFGHGTKFAKSVRADRVIAKHIGPNARSNLSAQGIEIEITKKSLDEILEEVIG